MAVYVGDAKVSTNNHCTTKNLVAFETVWGEMHRLLPHFENESNAKAMLKQWCSDSDTEQRRYDTFKDLARDLEEKSLISRSREGYYFQREGESTNITQVIHTQIVPNRSIGWDQYKFFQNLGHPDNQRCSEDRVSSRDIAEMLKDAFIKCDSDMVYKIQQDLKRRAEQEYLLQNMVKGAMYEAAEIANKYQVGIAVRGTGLLAHMGIESGDPTKPQEFKSKTSKEGDLWLCDELEWRDLGAVVHYDPRVGWTSQEAESHARNNHKPMFDNQPTYEEWLQKWRYIREIREPKLRRLVARIKQPPDEEALCKQFFERAKEYISYDYDYRHGDFAPYTTIHGPFIRLKVRPDVNIVGDHDLFAFTFPANDYGRLASVDILEVTKVQIALQKANTFQAQHDSIWDWNPQKDSNLDIKDRIMKAHSPNGNSPLVYIQPGNIITAAYYIPLEKKLSSVWDNSLWTEWLKTTHSGELYLSFVKQAENRSGESL